jgi:hypothetical protein
VVEGQHGWGIVFGVVKRINGLNNPFVLVLVETVTNDMAEKQKETADGPVPSRAMPKCGPATLPFGAFFGGRAHSGHAKTLN